MPPQVITDTAKHFEGKDDRYLMVVAVILLLIGGATVIRYLVRHLERLQTRNEEQTERNQERFEKQTEQLMQVAVSSQSVADSCRAALDSNTKILERVDNRLRGI